MTHIIQSLGGQEHYIIITSFFFVCFFVVSFFDRSVFFLTAYCKEKNFCVLHCGNLTEGRVTWAKVINGRKKDILTNDNGSVTKHSIIFRRYSSKGNRLIISKVLHSDAGRFYCNENTVDLSVVTGKCGEKYFFGIF